MLIHNASFMIETAREEEFISWLRARTASFPDRGRLTAMRQAAGVDYRHAEAQTVAWQLEFPTLDNAAQWAATVFPDIAAAFELSFGPQAMVFTSIFEDV